MVAAGGFVVASAYVIGEIVASFVDVADEAVSISTVGTVVS